MAWKLKDVSVRKATRGLIEEFATMAACPHDRPMSNKRMQVIGAALEGNTFRTCEWAAVHCHETKMTYRVNGKHTSTQLYTMNGTAPKGLEVIVERYEADTLEDVAKLYATFDTRSQSRSTGDINYAFAASVPELEDIGPKAISLCVTGMSFAIWEEGYGNRSAEERASLLIAHKEFVKWFWDTIGPKVAESKHLYRGAVVAAMFQTFKKAKGASQEFWTLVKDGSGTVHTTPDRKLNKMLLTNVVRGMGTTKAMDSREMYVKCLHAWNAWRRNEDTDLKYYSTAKTPTAL